MKTYTAFISEKYSTLFTRNKEITFEGRRISKKFEDGHYAEVSELHSNSLKSLVAFLKSFNLYHMDVATIEKH